jgi:hypothetical protein
MIPMSTERVAMRERGKSESRAKRKSGLSENADPIGSLA